MGINGTDVNPETRGLIVQGCVGGVVLRGRNVRDAAQAAALVASLQATAAEAGRGPLFIAVDQEGGDVTRLQEGLTHFPSAMALGATGDPELAYEVGRATAEELLAVGVNVVLAPVLDVLTQPDNTVIGLRSFGSDPALVARMGSEFVRGALDGGMIPVLKHYPGHGGTQTDSHAGLPTLETLAAAPFEAVLSATPGAPVVMVGHLWARELDPGPLPASLSSNVIGYLRRTFEGVILTDSLNMGAITNQRSTPEAAVLAFRAGADWLLVAEPGDVPAALDALRAAVQGGEISMGRLDASVRRLLTLRARLPGGEPPTPDWAAHSALAQEVARRALTWVCASSEACAQPLPRIPPGAHKVLLLAPNHLPPAEPGHPHFTYLAQLIAQKGFRVVELLYDLDDPARNADYVEQAALYANASEVTIFGAWDAYRQPGHMQADALRQARASGHPVVVLDLHLPFDAGYLGAGAYLATFGDTKAQMEAVVGALFGDVRP